MFRLDEVSNYKIIVIEGEIALPPHPYKSMFCRCFFDVFSMFCSSSLVGIGLLIDG